MIWLWLLQNADIWLEKELSANISIPNSVLMQVDICNSIWHQFRHKYGTDHVTLGPCMTLTTQESPKSNIDSRISKLCENGKPIELLFDVLFAPNFPFLPHLFLFCSAIPSTVKNKQICTVSLNSYDHAEKAGYCLFNRTLSSDAQINVVWWHFSDTSQHRQPSKMSTTSQKHRNFVAEPMGEKEVMRSLISKSKQEALKSQLSLFHRWPT